MHRRARPPGLAEGLGVQPSRFGGDGLFTNDKFCLTRQSRLVLSWRRGPLGADRLPSRAGAAVPGEPCPLGAGHEATALDGGAAPSRPPGGGATVGSGLTSCSWRRAPRVRASPRPTLRRARRRRATMRVAVYARVSTQRQAQARTTDQQLDRLRAHAEGQGWSLASDRVFRDDGYSGASLRRPGLDRLRDAAASARLDRILITEPDRLARNYVHQVLLVEELERHGAEVVFLDRPMSRGPHDQLLLQIRGAVAEYERTLIAERMRRGRLRKLRAGTLLPWTRPPYGYRVDPERPGDPAGVRLDEAEAAVVRDLFAWFTDEGATIVASIQRLARLGIASPRGHWTWNASALALQVCFRAISGLLRRHGSEVTGGGRRDRGCAGAVGRLASGGEAADAAAVHAGAGGGRGGAVP